MARAGSVGTQSQGEHRGPPPAKFTFEDDNAWFEEALCRGMGERGGDVFFKEGDDRRDYREAKTICRECPVKVRCRDYALEAGETTGCWGGMSPRERKGYKAAMVRLRDRHAPTG